MRILRHRVTLLAPARADTGAGGVEESFAEAGAAWAAIAAKGAAESAEPGRLHTRQRHELTLRFRTDAAPGWRVRWAGRERRVTAAFDPDGRRARTILICEEEE